MDVYVAVTWGSETERNCRVIGVFTSKEDAVNTIIESFDDDEGNIDMFRPYLENYYVIKPCDFFKIVKHRVDEPCTFDFIKELDEVYDKDGSLKIYKWVRGSGYQEIDANGEPDVVESDEE